MASWTATARAPRVFNETAKIEVVFSDGTRSVIHDFEVNSGDSVTNFAAAVASRRASIKAFFDAIDLFQTGLIADPAAKTPTQAELDQASFLSLIQSYRNAVAALKGGLGTTKQADIDAIVAQIKSAYKDAYAPFVVGVF